MKYWSSPRDIFYRAHMVSAVSKEGAVKGSASP